MQSKALGGAAILRNTDQGTITRSDSATFSESMTRTEVDGHLGCRFATASLRLNFRCHRFTEHQPQHFKALGPCGRLDRDHDPHPMSSRMGWPWSMSRRLRPGISRRRESRPSWCKIVAWMSPSRQYFRIRRSLPHPYFRRLVYRPTSRRMKNLCRRAEGSIRFRRDALPDLCEQSAAAGRVAALLARDEAGFCLTFGKDMCHEVVEQPLDTCSRVSRHAQQRLVSRFVEPIGNRFHGMAFRCCAGVRTLGDVNLSSPRPKSWRLRVT